MYMYMYVYMYICIYTCICICICICIYVLYEYILHARPWCHLFWRVIAFTLAAQVGGQIQFCKNFVDHLCT